MEMTTEHEVSSTAISDMISGLFKNRDDAVDAYQAVIDRGYSESEINVLMTEETRKKYFPPGVEPESQLGHKALEGAGAGAAIGGTAGAILAAVLAVGTSLVVPGIGLVIAGPLAAALAGAGAGGVAGGVIGALVGAGMSKDRAEIYHDAIKRGGIVLSVTPHNAADAEYIHNRWKELHAEQVYR
jgi:hypothetical protein